MDDTAKSLPSGTAGVFIPDLAWDEIVAWVRVQSQKTSGPFWYRGRLDPIVVCAGLSQAVDRAVELGIFGADATNRPALLAAKQLMTVNQLCEGKLRVALDDSPDCHEMHRQLERVAAVDGLEPPFTVIVRRATKGR